MTKNLDKLLMAEKSRLIEEIRSLQKSIGAAKAELDELQHRLRHVDGLLGEKGDSIANGSEPKGSTVRELTDIAQEILSERNRQPMHYKELAQEVKSRGGNLSGNNAANQLVARLVNDQRFVRPIRRGFYALRSDYPNAKNIGERKRRRTA